MKTLEQMRAEDALKRVNELNEKNEAFKKRYRAYVDRICPAIVMNGLGQTLATERAAAGNNPSTEEEKAHAKLYENLKNWLCREEGVYPPGEDILEAIVSHDEALYLHAQAEALAWLEWHKKFCRAMFPKGEEE